MTGTADADPRVRMRHSRDRPANWSALMARAQRGDRDAYCDLLLAITPYLRSLAARSHRTREDVEDTVQDILLTIHAIRHTYDPARPFAPWLVAIARRRIVDDLRESARHAAGARELSTTLPPS